MKPRLLDLFCGAGGAAMGYHRAGFEVVGVDIAEQPNYPFEFIQADALEYLANANLVSVGPESLDLGDRLGTIRRFDPSSEYAGATGAEISNGRVASMVNGEGHKGDGIAVIHASPPCQRFSAMSNCRNGLADEYPDYIAQVRELLQETGLPYVIENVPGAPLHDPVVLCGQMFGLELYRHRLFECSFPISTPEHPEHTMPTSKAGHWKPGTVMSVAGHVAPVAKAREVMGIDWTTRDELAEAVPPAFTEFIGTSLVAHLKQPTPSGGGE